MESIIDSQVYKQNNELKVNYEIIKEWEDSIKYITHDEYHPSYKQIHDLIY